MGAPGRRTTRGLSAVGMSMTVLALLLAFLAGASGLDAGEHGHSQCASSERQASSCESDETGGSGAAEGSCPAGDAGKTDGRKMRDENQWKLESEPVASEFIVRFSEYQHASVHKATLESHLEGLGDRWMWIDRVNKASALPTDFGVVQFDEALLGEVKSVLSGIPAVKDIHHNMKLTRSLMFEDDGETSRPVGGEAGSSGREEGAAGRPAWAARGAGRRARRSLRGLSDRARKAGQGAGTLDATAHLPDGEHPQAEKGPGRMQTKSSFDVHREEMEAGGPELWGRAGVGNLTADSRRRLLFNNPRNGVTSLFGAERLWNEGYSGKGVKMAVFDTGVRQDHPHFRNIEERSNWTHENTLNDGLGHGTFVAGVIASQDKACLGFAPDVEIHAFRVFTNDQVSYTSWFLDAFNYAIATDVNVLNLSIGGPDYLDHPFVEKIWEITSNNIIMVSAIGNDGPLYGTLNNPADQMDVIGVGGIDYSDRMASFSSRGMSTWELPQGYGRVKPDIVAFGRDVMGSRIQGGCRSLSGTSVASPVVAGAVCLLASVVPEKDRWKLLNPAVMKQALTESAEKVRGPHLYEQGQGRFDLHKAKDILKNYRPRASAVPPNLDFTMGGGYMWPHSTQPIYATMMPFIFNVTVVNGMGLTGKIPRAPTFEPSNEGGKFLDVRFTYSDVLWPWSGYLGVYVRVTDEGAGFTGRAEGTIRFTVVSPPGAGERSPRQSEVSVPLKHNVIPTPPREKRILWDQYHSVRYPPGYIPRDSLDVRNDILDWHGDHLHTNYHGMYDNLRDAGYYLEVLGSPLTCFDARNYGTLLMVDSEEEYYPEEVAKLERDVVAGGLGLVVFAEWYNVDTMVKMRFFDDNTRSWWTPATGGGNIPAMNDLLAPYGIALGDRILSGTINFGRERATYASGSHLQRFPAGGWVHGFSLGDRTGQPNQQQRGRPGMSGGGGGLQNVLGLVQAGEGRVTVYGDSNCLDSSHQTVHCYWLLRSILEFSSKRLQDPVLFPERSRLSAPLGTPRDHLPQRRTDVDFSEYSWTLSHPMACTADAPLGMQGAAAGRHGAAGGGEGGARQAGGGGYATPSDARAMAGGGQRPSFLGGGSRPGGGGGDGGVRDPVAEAGGRPQQEEGGGARPVAGGVSGGTGGTQAGGGVTAIEQQQPGHPFLPDSQQGGAQQAGLGGGVPSAVKVQDGGGSEGGLHSVSVFPTRGEAMDASFPPLDHNMPRILALTGGLVVFALWRMTRRRSPRQLPESSRPVRRSRAMAL